MFTLRVTLLRDFGEISRNTDQDIPFITTATRPTYYIFPLLSQQPFKHVEPESKCRSHCNGFELPHYICSLLSLYIPLSSVFSFQIVRGIRIVIVQSNQQWNHICGSNRHHRCIFANSMGLLILILDIGWLPRISNSSDIERKMHPLL